MAVHQEKATLVDERGNWADLLEEAAESVTAVPFASYLLEASLVVVFIILIAAVGTAREGRGRRWRHCRSCLHFSLRIPFLVMSGSTCACHILARSFKTFLDAPGAGSSARKVSARPFKQAGEVVN